MVNKRTAKRFFKLINEQFTYGGQKYALSCSTSKESTDVLFDNYGANWLYGTMHKYVFRYRNLARERDILKIATYAYIMWLKRGFNENSNGSKLVISTNVFMKEKNFKAFCDNIIYLLDENPDLYENDVDFNLNSIESNLFFFSKKDFLAVEECFLFNIFISCLHIWRAKYSKVTKHDTDTYNEKKS